jgi:hypothetical protein
MSKSAHGLPWDPGPTTLAPGGFDSSTDGWSRHQPLGRCWVTGCRTPDGFDLRSDSPAPSSGNVPICSSAASSSLAFIITMPEGPTTRTFPHRIRKSIPTTVDVCSEIENSPWTKESPSRQAYPCARGTGSEVLPFARVYKVVA